MTRLTRRLEILFPEDLADYLKQIAEREKCSVGTLIRDAVAEKYVASSQTEKLEAVERLCALEAPVGEWDEMEREIIEGALE
jgi:predicted DNA-binding ribbon-helix-helix protein